MATDYQLVLIDGSSYLFRAYHALPQLISSKGQPTGAIKGVSMVKKLMSDYPESQFVVVFDAKEKSSEMKYMLITKPIGLRCWMSCVRRLLQSTRLSN